MSTTGWLFLHATTLFGFLLAALLVGRLLRERRSSTSTVAWLLAIVLVPWVGVPLYLLLAVRKERVQAAEAPGGGPPGPPAEAVSPHDRLLRAYGIAPASRGNRVALCDTGEDAYRALVDLIESARHCIELETFILHPDEVGAEIVTRLAKRATDGIQVRLLLDAVGSFTTRARFLAPLTEAGGLVAFSGRLRRPWGGRANQRNHRKIVIGDGARVLAGGGNIASEYIGPTPLPDRWRDLAFVLDGPAVGVYEAIWRRDWQRATGERLAARALARSAMPVGEALAQVVPSGPDVPGDPHYAALLAAIWASTRRLWAVTPYFVPDSALSQAMAIAAQRGVDVRLLVPDRSNHRLADLARGTYLREVQQLGGRILLYEEGMVHAKAIVVDDDLAVIGSCNLDLRSLRLNYEASLFLYGGADVAAVAAWIEALAEGCREGVGEPRPARDLLEGAVRTLAPLL